MSMITLVEDAQIKRGEKDGKPYYYIEVQETVRKFINTNDGDYASKEALEDLSQSGLSVPQLKLHQRGKSLIFSHNDLN